MVRDPEAAIAALAKLKLPQLRKEWVRTMRRAPLRCRSAEILRSFLAWEIQEKLYGGLSADSRGRLRNLAAHQSARPHVVARQPAQLMPGTILTREWHGSMHKVTVIENGFTYDGRTFDDLSSIARAITGTRWSGPRFFRLRQEIAGGHGT